MPLVIRQATSADLMTLVAFSCRLAEESEGRILDRTRLQAGIEAALVDPAKGPYFVAELDGQVVGQIQVTFEWSDWRNGWFWWIQGVFVQAEHRRRGIFRALFEHVRQQALRQADVIGLRLYVEEHNIAARQTYARLGMGLTGYLVLEQYPLTDGQGN